MKTQSSFVTAVALLALCSTSVNAAGWTVTDLGSATGYGAEHLPMAINDNGWVVFGDKVMSPGAGGVYQTQYVSNIRQFFDINNSNIAVGLEKQSHMGMVWIGGNSASSLPVPTGSQSSWAYSINDSGQIVGSIYGGPLWGGTRWKPNGTSYIASQLGFMMNNNGGYTGGNGVSINSGGTALTDQMWPYYNAARSGPLVTTVISGTDDRDPRGKQPDLRPKDFCWDAQCVFLGRAINDANTVVGGANQSMAWTAQWKPFIWTEGGVELLPVTTPSGGVDGWANAINEGDMVVGDVWYAPYTYRATMWTKSGGNWNQTYLNDLLPTGSNWILTQATDVNEKGQIIGVGSFEGAAHVYLLTPAVPEPETYAMFLVGLGLVGVVLRRRKTQQVLGKCRAMMATCE